MHGNIVRPCIEVQQIRIRHPNGIFLGIARCGSAADYLEVQTSARAATCICSTNHQASPFQQMIVGIVTAASGFSAA